MYKCANKSNMQYFIQEMRVVNIILELLHFWLKLSHQKQTTKQQVHIVFVNL